MSGVMVHVSLSSLERDHESSFQSHMSIVIQKCPPHTKNLNSEMSGDSKNTYLHCRDVLGISDLRTMPLLARLCC